MDISNNNYNDDDDDDEIEFDFDCTFKKQVKMWIDSCQLGKEKPLIMKEMKPLPGNRDEGESIGAVTNVPKYLVNKDEVDGWVVRTKEELEALKLFRERIKDIADNCKWKAQNMSNDSLLCFLRARKLNLDKTEAMFREAYAWRMKVQPEEFVKRNIIPRVLDEYFTGGLFGRDRDGSPVYYDRLGQVDARGLLNHVSEVDFYEMEIMKMEYTTEISYAASMLTGIRHYQNTIIIDLAGLGSHHFYVPGFNVLNILAFVDDHFYPERAKRILILNAPMIFFAIWKIVQHFFDQVTREKIQIYKDGAFDVLEKYIERSMIPKFLGGDAEIGGNPNCTPLIPTGGRVPKDYHEEEYFDASEIQRYK